MNEQNDNSIRDIIGEMKMAFPMASLPIMQLMLLTIDETIEDKTLKDTLQNTIATTPNISSIDITLNTDDIIECYLSLEDINFDVKNDIQAVVDNLKITPVILQKIYETMGITSHLARVYYQGLLTTSNDNIKKFNTDCLYIDPEKHQMFLNHTVSKRIVPRVKFTTKKDKDKLVKHQEKILNKNNNKFSNRNVEK